MDKTKIFLFYPVLFNYSAKHNHGELSNTEKRYHTSKSKCYAAFSYGPQDIKPKL